MELVYEYKADTKTILKSVMAFASDLLQSTFTEDKQNRDEHFYQARKVVEYVYKEDPEQIIQMCYDGCTSFMFPQFFETFEKHDAKNENFQVRVSLSNGKTFLIPREKLLY